MRRKSSANNYLSKQKEKYNTFSSNAKEIEEIDNFVKSYGIIEKTNRNRRKVKK